MGNRKFRRMAEHVLLRYPFFAFERKNPSLKEIANDRDTQNLLWYFTASAAFLRGNAKKQKNAIWNIPQTSRLADLPAIRHACELYSLIAHKLDKLLYCLPMLWQSHQLQTTNWNFRLVSFLTQQGMFSAARNELSRFKLDVRRNMARYVLSNSKPFGLLPKTLPHSANFSLRSRDNWMFHDKITMLFYVCRHSRLSISN